MQIDEKALKQIAKTLTEAKLTVQLLVQGNQPAAEAERTLDMIHQARKVVMAIQKGIDPE